MSVGPANSENQRKSDPYLLTFVIGFKGFGGALALRNPVVTMCKHGLRCVSLSYISLFFLNTVYFCSAYNV